MRFDIILGELTRLEQRLLNDDGLIHRCCIFDDVVENTATATYMYTKETIGSTNQPINAIELLSTIRCFNLQY